MNAICVLLMTLWLASMILHVTLGGLVHLLALAVVVIVMMTGNHRTDRTTNNRAKDDAWYRLSPSHRRNP